MIYCISVAENNGEEAVNYYIETFNSAPCGYNKGQLGDITKVPKASSEVSGMTAGSTMKIECTL